MSLLVAEPDALEGPPDSSPVVSPASGSRGVVHRQRRRGDEPSEAVADRRGVGERRARVVEHHLLPLEHALRERDRDRVVGGRALEQRGALAIDGDAPALAAALWLQRRRDPVLELYVDHVRRGGRDRGGEDPWRLDGADVDRVAVERIADPRDDDPGVDGRAAGPRSDVGRPAAERQLRVGVERGVPAPARAPELVEVERRVRAETTDRGPVAGVEDEVVLEGEADRRGVGVVDVDGHGTARDQEVAGGLHVVGVVDGQRRLARAYRRVVDEPGAIRRAEVPPGTQPAPGGVEHDVVVGDAVVRARVEVDPIPELRVARDVVDEVGSDAGLLHVADPDPDHADQLAEVARRVQVVDVVAGDRDVGGLVADAHPEHVMRSVGGLAHRAPDARDLVALHAHPVDAVDLDPKAASARDHVVLDDEIGERHVRLVGEEDERARRVVAVGRPVHDPVVAYLDAGDGGLERPDLQRRLGWVFARAVPGEPLERPSTTGSGRSHGPRTPGSRQRRAPRTHAAPPCRSWRSW